MKKYGGELIHRSRDHFGDIEVVDAGTIRTLHFGSRYKQSTMDMSNPHKLYLCYARAMVCCLLFDEQPKKILILGLGAGAIAKFFLQQFPNCSIDAIEYREKVTKVAYGFFQLPEDPRLQVYDTDAAIFIHSADESRFADYDLILVDLYDESGPATALSTDSFYQRCKDRLSKQGIVSINLWGSEKQIFKDTANMILTTFKKNALFFSMKNYGNIIGLCFNETYSKENKKKLKEKAETLEQEYEIEFKEFVKSMHKNNTHWFK